MTLFALVFARLAVGVIAAFARPRWAAVGRAWVLLTAGCGLMAWIAVGTLAIDNHQTLIELALPLIGPLDFELTPLAALFLLVTVAVFAVALPIQLHDSLDWSRARRGAFVAFVALTLAAMLALFTTASIVAFLVAWEIAALGIWARVGFETRQSGPVAPGLLTMALSEVGSLAGLAGLLLLALAAGSPNLDTIAVAAPTLPPGVIISGCVLTLFGFGMKAGVMPLNPWLTRLGACS